MARTDEGNLVEAARSGDSQAFGKLFDAWFDRVHDLSRRIVKDTGTAGEVAQDAFLTAWTRLDSLEDPDAFGGWLLRIARNASLNRLSKERRSVALDSETMTTLTDLDAPDHDPLASMDQAARIDLVWDAAAALGERDMSILDLHLRHGLRAPELAEELGTTPNNAHQILFTLRKRLGTNVRALVLWRAGRPACGDLRRALAAAGIATFDKQAVKAIDRHATMCDACNDERTERLAPAALFGAAPVVAAPMFLKAQAASALEAAGVPMSGSASLGGAGGVGGAGGAGATSPPALPLPRDRMGSPLDDTDGSSDARPDGGPDGGSEGDGAGSDGMHIAASKEPSRSRRNRLMAVAAVVLVLVGAALLLAGAFSDAPVEEVTAGDAAPDTSEIEPASTDTSPASDPSDAATSTEGGSFSVGDDDPSADDPVASTDGGTDAPPWSPDGPVIVDPPTSRPQAPPTTTTTPANPTTTRPTTTSTTTTAAPKPPVIVRLTAVSSGYQCRRGLVYEVAWATEHADTTTLYGPGSATVVPTNGSLSLCVERGDLPTFSLDASGPGGYVSQEVTGEYLVP